MTIFTHTNLFAASISALAVASVLAETPEALVKQALERNPELNFFVAEIAAAKGAVRTARSIRNPELSSELGYKNSRSNSDGSSSDGAILALSLSQTFEYPGRIALRKAIANHDVELAELHLQQFRLTLAARVRTLAYGISSAQQRSVAAHGLRQCPPGVACHRGVAFPSWELARRAHRRSCNSTGPPLRDYGHG